MGIRFVPIIAPFNYFTFIPHFQVENNLMLPQPNCPGWLLLFFTTVAVSVPFGMILQIGSRLILIAFYGGDVERLPEWMKFIYSHAKDATDRAHKLFMRGIGCAPFLQATPTGPIFSSKSTSLPILSHLFPIVEDTSNTPESHEWGFQNKSFRWSFSGVTTL